TSCFIILTPATVTRQLWRYALLYCPWVNRPVYCFTANKAHGPAPWRRALPRRGNSRSQLCRPLTTYNQSLSAYAGLNRTRHHPHQSCDQNPRTATVYTTLL